MSIALICLMLTYAGLGVFAWQRHREYDSKIYPLKVELAVLSVTLLMHEVALLMPVLRDNVLVTDFGYLISLIARLMLMIYCLGSFLYCLHELQLLLYPCATIILLLGWVFPGRFVGYRISDLPFMLHTVSSLPAYGLFKVVTLSTVLILSLIYTPEPTRHS